MRKSKKHQRPWHGLAALTLVVVIGIGFSLAGRIEAQFSERGDGGDSQGRGGGRRVELPKSSVDEEGKVKDIGKGVVDSEAGEIGLGENKPSGTPGTAVTQPAPRFSIISTPAILNEEGPLEIPDDMRVFGLTELVGGLINNGGASSGGQAALGGTIGGTGGGATGGGGQAPGDRGQPTGVSSQTTGGGSQFSGSGSQTPGGGATGGGTPDTTGGGTSGGATGGITTDTTTTQIQADLLIATNTETPICDSLSKGASADVAKFNIHSPKSNLAINSLTITRSGTANAGDIQSISIYDEKNSPIATDIPASEKNPAVYSTTLKSPIRLNPSQTKNLMVRVNVSGQAASDAKFTMSLADATSVTVQNVATGKSVTVGGNLPANGNTCKISAAAQTPQMNINPQTINVQEGGAQFTVTLSNPSSNSNSETIETIGVRVASTADLTGITTQLTETGANTGEFTGIILAHGSFASDAAKNRIQVNTCDADTIVVTTPPTGEAKAFAIATTQPRAVKFARDTNATSGTLAAGEQTLLQFSARACSEQIAINKIYVKKEGTTASNRFGNFKLEKQNKDGTWSQVAPTVAAITTVSGRQVVNITIQDGLIIGATNSVLRLRGNVTQLAQTYKTFSTVDFRIEYPTDISISAPVSTSILDVPMPSASRSVAYIAPMERHPGKIFGSLIPTAYAQAGDALAENDLMHPVTVYDDFFVHGNGAEPGNVVINGWLRAGQVGGLSQITGDLRVIGGKLTVGGDAEVTGNISASAIGSFYRVDASSSSYPINASCGKTDILVSCSGNFTGDVSSTQFDGTSMNGNTCTAYGRKTGMAARILRAQAVCFNPNRDASKPPAGVDL